MAMTAAVVGASGYAGGELVRLLAGHPVLRPVALTAGRQAGQPLSQVHQQLVSLGDLPLLATDPDQLPEVDLVFVALPPGESAPFVDALAADQRVVDLGADFRLADAGAWQRYYGAVPHAGSWPYGLPELPGARAQLAGSSRVANPGCYATAVAVSLVPLVGPLGATEVVVVAASGASGAGRTSTTGLLGAELMGSAAAYKVGGIHQHTPEMEQTLSGFTDRPVTVSFTPVLAPMARGILATSSFAAPAGTTTESVRGLLADAYADEQFVHVLPEGGWPRTGDVLGSNAALLQAAVDDHAGRVVVVCALDNLGKGAAGQAVQNANLMLGLPEDAGLCAIGVAP
jgi:N-acetyl-gamma-glutamyl-phosphate reductase